MSDVLRPLDFLTIQQVADRFRRSISWVRRQPLLRVGLGRAPLYHRRAIDAFEVSRRYHNAEVLRQAQTAAVAAYYKLPYERNHHVTLILRRMRAMFDNEHPKRPKYRAARRDYSGLRGIIKYAHSLIRSITRAEWYRHDGEPEQMLLPPRMPAPEFFCPSLWRGLEEQLRVYCYAHYSTQQHVELVERMLDREDEKPPPPLPDPLDTSHWTCTKTYRAEPIAKFLPER